jgi:hypothetical protein
MRMASPDPASRTARSVPPNSHLDPSLILSILLLIVAEMNIRPIEPEERRRISFQVKFAC